MKRFLAIFALLGAALLPAQTLPGAGTDHSITAQFSQPSGTVQWPMQYCSTGVTASCVKGYTEVLTPPAGVPGTVTQTIAAGSTDISGTTITHQWAPGGLLYCGTWNISIVANWLDSTGTAVNSTPLTGSVTEACPFVASPATGLTLSVAP